MENDVDDVLILSVNILSSFLGNASLFVIFLNMTLKVLFRALVLILFCFYKTYLS